MKLAPHLRAVGALLIGDRFLGTLSLGLLAYAAMWFASNLP